jgi:hypothetical protein
MKLRHTKSDGTPCTAFEYIAALAKNPNGWMYPQEQKECETFVGTDEDAAKLLLSLEEACSARFEQWSKYQ